MKAKYKLKKSVKKIIAKSLITLMFILLDIIIYRNLMFLDGITVKTSWGSAIAFVGWFWLMAGQFMTLYTIWE